ncbi:MAG TPA: hypothetical protein PK705_02060 [Clostridia bacterium]|jgi:hypothetical protein|nr:hypothetical protein [Clostridia bacterium]NLV33729.1 hypothetical protein [Clostridiaceae bacterium]HQM95767.1 hypothetical protein [Clostridia bacterium]HQO69279.1 hypothetical protein [Clostridia bacterium]
MNEYYRKPDDINETKQEETPSAVVKQLEEHEDYDLIKDLLENSETLVKGIILSEILSKPKAKR